MNHPFDPRRRAVRPIVALALVALVLAGGCRQSEKDRPLHYEKGVYGGAPSQALDDATVKQIRVRHRRQNFGL